MRIGRLQFKRHSTMVINGEHRLKKKRSLDFYHQGFSTEGVVRANSTEKASHRQSSSILTTSSTHRSSRKTLASKESGELACEEFRVAPNPSRKDRKLKIESRAKNESFPVEISKFSKRKKRKKVGETRTDDLKPGTICLDEN